MVLILSTNWRRIPQVEAMRLHPAPLAWTLRWRRWHLALVATMLLPAITVLQQAQAQENVADSGGWGADVLLAQLNATHDMCPEAAFDDAFYSELVEVIARSELFTEDPITVLLPLSPVTPILRGLIQVFADRYKLPISCQTPQQLPATTKEAFGYYFQGFLDPDYNARIFSATELLMVLQKSLLTSGGPIAAYAGGDNATASVLEIEDVLPSSYRPLDLYRSWVALYYNVDMLERNNLTVPVTWDELLTLAQQVNNTDLDGDGEPDAALCIDMMQGCKGRALLSTIYASMAQTNGSSQGMWFDRQTFEPLFPNPAMAEALRVMRELSEYGSAECSVLNRQFVAGQCLMTLDWVTPFHVSRGLIPDGAVFGRIGLARTPGSTLVWPDQSKSEDYDPSVARSGLVACTAGAPSPSSRTGATSLCPNAVWLPTMSSDGTQLVNRPLFSSAIGITTSTNVQQVTNTTSAFLDTAAAVMSRMEQLYEQKWADTMTLFAKVNATAEDWAEQGYDFDDGARYFAFVMDALNSTETNAQDIGMPFSQLYRLTVHMMVQQAIRGTDQDIASIMKQGKANFTFVQQVYPFKHTQLLFYNATLGVKATINQHNTTVSVDKQNLDVVLPAVLVPSATVLLSAFVLLWLYMRKMRRSHKTLLGRSRPPGVGAATTLVVTDIQSSTVLWEALPADVMDAAIRLHHKCIRSLLLVHHGYESATEGDSFICSFYQASEAVAFSAATQVALRDVDWPPELLRHPEAKEMLVTADVSTLTDANTSPRQGRLGLPSFAKGSLLLNIGDAAARHRNARRMSDTSMIASPRATAWLSFLNNRSADTNADGTHNGSPPHGFSSIFPRRSIDIRPREPTSDPTAHISPRSAAFTGLLDAGALAAGVAGDGAAPAIAAHSGTKSRQLAGGASREGSPPPHGSQTAGHNNATGSASPRVRSFQLQLLLQTPAFRDVMTCALSQVAANNATGTGTPLQTAGSGITPAAEPSQSQEEVGTEISMTLGWSWAQLLKAWYTETGEGSSHMDDRSNSKCDLDTDELKHKGASVVFRGLRVRIGIHSGVLSGEEVTMDKATQRVQYSGAPLVAAKTIGDAAQGGMILMSAAAFVRLQHDKMQFDSNNQVRRSRHGGKAWAPGSSLIITYAGRHDLALPINVTAHGSLQVSAVMLADAPQPAVLTVAPPSTNVSGGGWIQRAIAGGLGGVLHASPDSEAGASDPGALRCQSCGAPLPTIAAANGLSRPGVAAIADHVYPDRASVSAILDANGASFTSHVDRSPRYTPKHSPRNSPRNSGADQHTVHDDAGAEGAVGHMQLRQASCTSATGRLVPRMGSATASALQRHASVLRALRRQASVEAVGGGGATTSAHTSNNKSRRGSCTSRTSQTGVLPELAGHDLYMAVPLALQARLGHLGPVRSKQEVLQGTLSAPAPGAAIVFMHAYGANLLLADLPGPAKVALAMFRTCVLQQLSLAGGYLVETADGFVLAAFSHPAPAIVWAVACSEELNKQPWPEAILEHELGMEVVHLAPHAPSGSHTSSAHEVQAMPIEVQFTPAAPGPPLPSSPRHLKHDSGPLSLRAMFTGRATPGADGGANVFTAARGAIARTTSTTRAMVTLLRGIRLRCGIDVGIIKPEVHPVTGRMVYRGRVMNRAARISTKAAPGQVLASSSAWYLSEDHEAVEAADVCGHELGAFELKGVLEPVELVKCVRAS